MTRPDGSLTDVNLNKDFMVISSKTDPPGSDVEPDGDGD